MSELAHLFSPITIRNLTIRNRIFQAAHVTGFVENGLPTDRHVRYYEARAKGGIGLIIQEGTTVSPWAQYHPEIFAQGWKDGFTARLKKISEAVHAHGAGIFLQLWHGGTYSSSNHTWVPGVSSSEIPSCAIGEVPVLLDEEGIQGEIQAHVSLAVKAKEAGYDGVELNFGHGYLQQQFLSPSTNLRSDLYGGSLENRMRFGLEIIGAVRQALGEDLVLGLRTSADEFIPSGYTLDDIIKNHEADMVAMTRATLCDPDLPRKAKEGRIDDIRLCVACNEGCWEQFEHQEPITCMQNPEVGREGVFRIEPAAKPKKVMVIGGGCAGMEAAVVAKQRGHDVALYEKDGELGGAILIPAKTAGRQELGQVVRFLKHEVERLGVQVHLNTEMTAERVLEKGPDTVVVATGGTTVDDPSPEVVGPSAAIEIENGAHVVTAEDVLDGKAQTGRRVVIADQQNYMKGLITAEFLAEQGKEVTLVMPVPIRLTKANSYDIDILTLSVQLVNLKTKGARRISDYEVKKAGPGRVVLQDIFTEALEEMEADTLVLSSWRKANTSLFAQLKGRVKEIHRIGDALAPRRLLNAIYEGYKTAVEI